jgi:hypothetical protein
MKARDIGALRHRSSRAPGNAAYVCTNPLPAAITKKTAKRGSRISSLQTQIDPQVKLRQSTDPACRRHCLRCNLCMQAVRVPHCILCRERTSFNGGSPLLLNTASLLTTSCLHPSSHHSWPKPSGDMNPLVDRYPSLRPCDRLCTCSDTTSAPPRRLQYRAHER